MVIGSSGNRIFDLAFCAPHHIRVGFCLHFSDRRHVDHQVFLHGKLLNNRT